MEEFNKLFKITTKSLNIIRLNPYVKKDKIWGLQYLLLHGFYTFGFIVAIYNIIYSWKINNFTQICKHGILFVVYVEITFQCSVLLYQGSDIIRLIEDVKENYELSVNLPVEEQKIMTEYTKKGVMICKLWIAVTSFAFLLFLVKNIVFLTYYYVIGEPRLVYFYELDYPEVVVNSIPAANITLFLFSNVLMMFFDLFSGVSYVAFAPLGPIFLMHACSQLEIIKGRINKVFDERDDEVIQKKIRNIILHLNCVYGFVDRIKACFKLTYELTLKATTLLLPISLYEVIESLKRGEFGLEFLIFVVGGFLIVASPCFYSDLLMQKGEEVRMAIYTCGWENHYDLRVRSALLLVLQRALRPVAIRTLFRIICLDALTDLLQQAYTIFNLMNAMWN